MVPLLTPSEAGAFDIRLFWRDNLKRRKGILRKIGRIEGIKSVINILPKKGK
jgi:hypothetical protein